jgi:ATP-binding cassette, subfamily C, bacterial CydD
MNLDRRLFNQSITVKQILAAAIVLGFLAGIFTVLQARQLSRVISGVFLGGQDLPAVMPLLTSLLIFVAARAGSGYLSELTASAAALRVKQDLRDRLARHLLALGPASAVRERSGEIVNTLTQGIEMLDAYFSQFLPQLALAGLLPLAFLTLVFPLDPLSGLVLLLTGPLIPFFMFLIGSHARDLTGRQWLALGRMSAYFLDTLQGLATLKSLGRSREQAGRIAQVSERYRSTTMEVLRVTFLSALVLELLGTIGTAIIAVQIGLRLLYGMLGFEEAFFILLLAPEFYLPLRSLGLRFHASMSGVSAARRIYEILEQPLPPEPARAATMPFVSLREPFSIRMEHVVYTYPGRSQPALEDVSFSIASGERIALIGASGAGKTTIAQLLLRFIHPQQGNVQVNGSSLFDLSAEDWRAQLAWVPQQPYLFYGSIGDNMRIANPEASPADMEQAAEQAFLAEWVRSLPQGFDTQIGEGGARLSGGQAQRLALARAFLRQAPFLILDEATAHLDVEHERLLQASTAELCRGRTALIIAHRLSSVKQADRIIVMEAGRITEMGTPASLNASGGAYAQMLAAYEGRGAL